MGWTGEGRYAILGCLVAEARLTPENWTAKVYLFFRLGGLKMGVTSDQKGGLFGACVPDPILGHQGAQDQIQKRQATVFIDVVAPDTIIVVAQIPLGIIFGQ